MGTTVAWAGIKDPFSTDRLTSSGPAQAWGTGAGATTCNLKPAPHQALSLVDVINLALCYNPQTRQAWANARAQAAQVGVSEAAYLPTLNLSAQASRDRTSSSAGFTLPAQDRLGTTLSFNYLLFDFGGRSAALDAARASLAAANWTQNATLQSVLLSSVQDYYQLFAARTALGAAVEAERSSRESLEAAGLRYRVGAASLADKLQAQTAYSQARLNRQNALGQEKIARGTLANLLGLDADYPLRIAAPPIQRPEQTLEQNVRQLIEEAKRLRPDLAAAEAQVRAARANVQETEANGMPSLSLFGNYGYDHSSVFNNTRDYSVGLAVTMPLFTGFGDTYRIRAAQQQLQAQIAQRDKLEQQVALDVWRAYQNFETTRDTLTSSADVLESAKEAQRVALGQYKTGTGSMLDLLTAQSNLANARMQRIQAQYNWYIAKATLAQTLGRLNPSNAVSTPPGPAPQGAAAPADEGR